VENQFKAKRLTARCTFPLHCRAPALTGVCKYLLPLTTHTMTVSYPFWLKITTCFFCSLAAVSAQGTGGGVAAADTSPAVEAEPEAANAYRAAIQRLDPMDTTGLDYGLANVLRNYYRQTFTSAENWEKIESIRYDGTLHLSQGPAIEFTVFKKKPDFCKVVLSTARGEIIMAYNGVDAWQLSKGAPNAGPQSIPDVEAQSFIREAVTGGHLLYPIMEGKAIQLLGTVRVDDQRAFELQVDLPNGVSVRSMLDMTDYAELRQVVLNPATGKEEVTTHSDFRVISGVRFPFVSKLTIDGGLVHESRIRKVETNTGTMPWFFDRPAGPEEATRGDDSASPLGDVPYVVPGGADVIHSKPVDQWSPSVFELNQPADAANDPLRRLKNL